MNSEAPLDRAPGRERRLLRAYMQHPRTGLIDIMIRNVSDRGIGGKCVHDIEPGEIVSIIVPDRAPMDGMIVWRMGDGFGMRLTALIDPKAIMHQHSATASRLDYQVPKLFRPPLECRRPGLRT
jgi:hypothetical protein